MGDLRERGTARGWRRAGGWMIVATVASVAPGPATAAQEGRGDRARTLLERAVEAMGGEARWRDLRSLRLETIGHEHWLEQSERPEGPWIAAYVETEELRDLDGGRIRRTRRTRHLQAPEGARMVLTGDAGLAAWEIGGRTIPARPGQREDLAEALALAPERLLLTALDAKDLRLAEDSVIHGVLHRRVAFTWSGRRARLLLNAESGLPTGLELWPSEADPLAVIWGDTPRTWLYSTWALEPGGRLYPRQIDELELGMPRRSTTILRVAFGVPAPADSFAIPAEVREAPSPPAFDYRTARPLQTFRGPVEARTPAPGIVFLPGFWNVTLVRQEDGLVVLEAPISVQYTGRIAAEAAERFPGVPIRAAVSTSDAWPHIGGVPGWLGRDVPVWALDMNLSLLRRLDGSRRDGRAGGELRPVGAPVTLGEGPNRMQLLPIGGEAGERMLAAWFPEHRLLYASDLIQPGREEGTFFWPANLLDVEALVERHGLPVETVFGMHLEPTPWQDVVRAIEAASAAPPAADEADGDAGR